MTEGTSRRLILKTAAAIPLAFTFGLVASPLLRFLRPTIKPLDLLGPSDQPKPKKDVNFKDSDFPEAWTCIPFMFEQTYKEYNPEGQEVRKIPGYIVSLPNGEKVAYSRICPHLGCVFNFVKDPEECAKGYNYKPSGPVFACPCHLSVYDIAQGGKVVSGPAPRPPRRFDLKKDGDNIAVLSLEAGELPSTTKDAGLLGALVKTNDWLKTRIANIDIFDEHYQIEAKTNPFYAIGSIFYLVWVIVMLTGVVLIMWYIPTKAAAYDSILNIQHGILFGNIVRGMHKYGADAMIIAATIRMFRMFIMADYKPGKEFNIAIGLVTLLLSMYSGLTGYLLIWNQRAFWATKVFATFPTYMDQFPGMGDFYLPLVKSMHMGWNTAEFLLGAGGAITQETITRFFSLHLAFSLIPLIFVELYFYKTGYRRININWTKRNIVILMIAVVSIILPAALGGRSNPDVTPLPILSDWYFLGLYQMYKYLEPVVATEITMVIPLSVVLLPFIDVWLTGPEKDITKRPMIFWVTLMGLINWIVFSFLIIFNIANIHNDPPFWRDSLYLMIDIGILLQLALIWRESNLVQRAKGAFAGMVMGIMGLVQTVVALVYFFMAKTEMFLSPLTQAWTYGLFRPFMGANANTAETLVREGIKGSIPYWDYHTIIAKGGDIPPVVKSVADICQQSTPLDGIFALAPTFIAGIKYNGLIDFMVSNRWCFDYATYTDRMNGVGASVLAQPIPGNPPYPMPVPTMDWVWMIAGAVVMVAGFGTMWWCKKSSQQQAQAQATAAQAS